MLGNSKTLIMDDTIFMDSEGFIFKFTDARYLILNPSRKRIWALSRSIFLSLAMNFLY